MVSLPKLAANDHTTHLLYMFSIQKTGLLQPLWPMVATSVGWFVHTSLQRRQDSTVAT